jgi:hypothetical protein
MERKISSERKAAYYIGLAVSAVGLILFSSVFFTAISGFGDFDNFEERGRSTMMRAFGGMALIIAGRFISRIGARGVAGSGLVLYPERAGEDLEPWARTGGKLVGDAIAELQRDGDDNDDDDEPEIKVRCRACKALNDENARFCDQCGAEM